MYIHKRDTFRVYNKVIKKIPSIINARVLDSPADFDGFIDQLESAYECVIHDDLQKLLDWKKKNPKRNYRRLVTFSDIVFSLEDALNFSHKRNKDSFCDGVFIWRRNSLWLYEFSIIEEPSLTYRLSITPNKNNKKYTKDLEEEIIVENVCCHELFCQFIDRWIADHINE